MRDFGASATQRIRPIAHGPTRRQVTDRTKALMARVKACSADLTNPRQTATFGWLFHF